MVLVSKPLKRFENIERELGKLNFLIPDVVIDELRRLELCAGPKRSLIAKTAIEIANSKFGIIELGKQTQVDDVILEFSKASKCAVATLDKKLKTKLLKHNILLITLSKDRLTIEYPSAQ